MQNCTTALPSDSAFPLFLRTAVNLGPLQLFYLRGSPAHCPRADSGILTFAQCGEKRETGVAALTLGQWQVKPGGGPVVTSQDPPLEQGWLWQGSVSTSHLWPVVGARLEITHGFSHCLCLDLHPGVQRTLCGQEDAEERGGGRG